MLKRSVAVITLGCKVNKYESDSMKDKLCAAGFTLVEPEDVADFYIVNTCSVTNMAEKKSRQMLRRAKRRNPAAVIIAAGCYVNALHDELLRESFVDIAVGNNCKKDIVEVICDYMANHEDNSFYTDIGQVRDFEEMGPLCAAGLDHQRAYIKIQDGCNQFCAYCLIPYTRGRARSRKPEDIMDEVRSLAKNGVKEFVLTGIHISSYGVDFNEQTGEPAVADLGSLVQAIAQIPEVRRIRLGSLEPRVITKTFLERIAGDKLCPHFHLSLQSACNDTLKRMNRRYTIEEFVEKCRMLREHFAMPAITTDVIVGFPGETEEEFAETVENLGRLKLYEIHVFKYSVRTGTVAERMPGQVPETVKNKRSEQLLAMTARQKAEYEESLSGLADEVLIEEACKNLEENALYVCGKPEETFRKADREAIENGEGSYYVGHTKRYVRLCVFANSDKIGHILSVIM